MKRIVIILMVVLLLVVFVACNSVTQIDACNSVTQIEKIINNINNLSQDEYFCDTWMNDWRESGIDLTGRVLRNYLIYEFSAKMQVNADLANVPEYVPADYNKPMFEACEIIVIEFEMEDDADKFINSIFAIIDFVAVTEGEMLPDWIGKRIGNLVVMAISEEYLNLLIE